MLQGFGIQLGLRLLLRGKPLLGARLIVQPVHYWRHAEYAAALEALLPMARGRVLDVGSPKLLSLYLAARRGLNVEATDLNDYFIADFRAAAVAAGVDDEQYKLAVADGRKLLYGDETFDFVYAISVVEHIPGDGDSECLRELRRVLRPGGRGIVTVPFAPEARDEFRLPDFYWARDGQTAAKPATRGNDAKARSEDRVFYQRRYDEEGLRKRLIAPSGLRLASLRFIGERVMTGSPSRQLADYLPPWTGPLHGILAALCLTPPQAEWKSLKKPLCALIVLEKA